MIETNVSLKQFAQISQRAREESLSHVVHMENVAALIYLASEAVPADNAAARDLGTDAQIRTLSRKYLLEGNELTLFKEACTMLRHFPRLRNGW
jgi:hypothetical protein